MKLKKIISPLFNVFSSNGLRSNNPKVRIRCIMEELEPGSTELTGIAINDAEFEVRSCAIQRITNLDEMQTVIMKLNDDESKKAAYQQFAKLLCGEVFPVADIEQREQIINSTLPDKIFEYIAINAKEAQLRIQAIHKLNRDALLGDIALNDNSSQVKISAAVQIGKKSTLERVCKKSRSKDKRVYKICKEKLDRIIEDEQRPQRINREVLELCEQLEKIFKRNLLLQEEPTINNLYSKWQEYKNFANEETRQRYQLISEKINSAIEQLKLQQQNEIKTRENLQQIIHSLSMEAEELLHAKESNNAELIESRLKVIEFYKQSWNEQILQLTEKKHKDIIEQYHNILMLIENAEDQRENLSNIELLKQYISRAEQLLNSSHYIGEKFISSLQNNFNEEYHRSDQSNSQVNECKNQFKEKFQLLEKRLENQQQEYQQLNETAEKLIAQINNTLEQGETDKALQLKNQYLNLVEKSSVISEKVKDSMLNKVRSSNTQLNQLNSWKNWANNHQRESLCQQAEQLFEKIRNADDDITTVYNEYGDQVKALRSQWKSLKGRSPDQLWEHFNDSCNQCFDYFKPHFEQQKSIREKNLALKESICKQLEDYIEYMGWPSEDDVDESKIEETDWVQVNKILRQAKAEWNSIGPVDKKQNNNAYKRYTQAVDSINRELKKIWRINQKKYQLLIDQVFALHKTLDMDLAAAINEAKSLQAQWNQLGPVQHYQRKTLWKNFRKGCDVIFNKREQRKAEQDQKNEIYILEKTGLCENLEALNKQDLSINDLNNAFADIEATWEEISKKTPAKHKAVENRFDKAKQHFSKKINQLYKLEQQQQLELLKKKAGLCSNAENKPENHNWENWNKLDKLNDNALEKRIETRFEQAAKLSEPAVRDSLMETTYKQKEQLCLNLEILTNQPSPEDQSQRRVEFQIQLMNDKSIKLPKTVNDSIMQWYLLPDFEQHNELNDRFFSILD